MDEDDIRMSNDGGDESFLEMIPALAAALGSGVGLFRGFGTAGAKLAKLRKLKPKTEMEKELVAELEKALKYRQKSDKQIRDLRSYSPFSMVRETKPPLNVALDEDKRIRALKDYYKRKGYDPDEEFDDIDRISVIRDIAKRFSKYPKGSSVPRIDKDQIIKQFLDENKDKIHDYSYGEQPVLKQLEREIRMKIDPSYIYHTFADDYLPF